MSKLNHPEDALQRAVLHYLSLAVARNYIVVAIPNGGKRNKIEAAIMKNLGVRAGTPDIHISGDGFSGWLELKVPPNKLSPAQREFRDECLKKSIPWAEIHNLEEVEAFISRWSLGLHITGRMPIVNPVAPASRRALRGVSSKTMDSLGRATDLAGQGVSEDRSDVPEV